MMPTITERQFKKLCDDIYADRREIYQFNPGMSRRDALLWMLTGCLFSFLSIPILEQSGADATSPDFYADAVRELLQQRMTPPFNPQVYIDELVEKIKVEDEQTGRAGI